MRCVFTCMDDPGDASRKGWVKKGMEEIPDPIIGSGLIVAHDMLEHFSDDDMSLEAEAQAHGAMLRIRGLTGWFIDAPKSISAFFEDTYQVAAAHILRMQRCEPQKPLEEGWSEKALGEIKRLGEIAIIAMGEEKVDETLDMPLEGYLTSSIEWMRVGYRRAEKRYSKAAQIEQTFNQIMKASDDALEYAEYLDRLVINADLRRCLTTWYVTGDPEPGSPYQKRIVARGQA